ncbi:MAG: sulfite exporter TauE/SafE family protein [Dehalococcoidia bacterium]|nr:sulfite exporter TauE/SafE family protein [Dehalococcoidia bacterium]
MPWYEPIALIALGLFGGTYGAIVGAGGGFVMSPTLILVWGFQPSIAVGTSLAAVLVTSISAAIGYARTRFIDYKSGVLLAMAEMPGLIFGAVAVKKASGALVLVSYGLLIIGISLFLMLRKRPTANTKAAAAKGSSPRTIVTSTGLRYEYSFRAVPTMSVTAMFGFLSSFFGIGGGLLRVPMLISIFGFPVTVATATSMFAMSLSVPIGVASHALLGNINWPVFFYLSIGALAGGQVGAKVAPKLRARVVVIMLSLGLLATGATLIIKGLSL